MPRTDRWRPGPQAARRRPGARAAAVAAAAVLAGLGPPSPARAGHEFPFYPSFYPQEITVETVGAAEAARRLRDGTLHAYAGADPFGPASAPADVPALESFEAYVIVTPEAGDGASRCLAGRAAAAALRADVFRHHASPVTPLHPDWLHQADRVGGPGEPAPSPVRQLRLRPLDAAAEALVPPAMRAADPPLDGTVRTVPLTGLLADDLRPLNGWAGPPWVRAGWYHAHRLLAGGVADRARRRAVDQALARLTSGEPLAEVDRINLERHLVTRLTEGCEQVVAGYTVRRQRINADYSKGVENVGHDALTGLDTPVFARTVKLKDFPWNGWLTVGVPASVREAWNPLTGLADPAGRLVWAALGAPALFPSPHGPGWVANRTLPEAAAAGPVTVPTEAVRPEPGTGRLRPVPPGTTAAGHLRYRVLASAFHDGTRMTVGDLLFPFVLAARWGGPTGDPDLARRTGGLREHLVGIQPIRVDTTTLAFGEDKLTYEVPVVDVFLDWSVAAAGGLSEAATLVPPWSALPWHVLALADEAARRGLVALSREEAARLGRPWLDLVRDAGAGSALRRVLDDLAAAGRVPAGLEGYATPEEARARWKALQAFHDANRHFLVTAGPYRLTEWTEDRVVLRVFRDLSFPRGVGSYDPLAHPLHAHVRTIDRQGQTLVVTADIERVERAGREVRVIREPFVKQAVERDRRSLPVARFLALDGAGTVRRAGMATAEDPGTFRIEPGPGTARVALALTLDGVTDQAPVTVVPWTP